MKRRTERHTAVLDKLQGSLKLYYGSKYSSEFIVARCLTVEKWVDTYIKQIEHLKDAELNILCKVFADKDVWFDTKLNNEKLGKELIDAKYENGNQNIIKILDEYVFACKYCIKDRIMTPFQHKIDFYEGRLSPEAVENRTVRARNMLLDSMKNRDPVLSFWINKQSGELKEYNNIAGFEAAVKLRWSEGVEHFYYQLSKQENISEQTSNLLIDTIKSLSDSKHDHNSAIILDFCLSKIDDDQKKKLLYVLSESEKDEKVYWFLTVTIHGCFLNTVQDIIKLWFPKNVISVHTGKILSHRNHAILLSLLSDVILERPALSIQAKSIMLDLWEYSCFDGHKKSAFEGNAVNIKNTIARLIVAWERDGNENTANIKKEDKILNNILLFAKNHCSTEGFERLIKDIVDDLKITNRIGMKKDINYAKLAQKLFLELVGSGNNLDSITLSNLSSRSK